MLTTLSNCSYTVALRCLLRLGIDEQNQSTLSLIRSDLYRWTGSTDWTELYPLVLKDPGFQFVVFLRLASMRPKSVFRKRIHAFSYYFHKKYFLKYGFQIPIQTSIGAGFQILHFGHIIFNPAATIGTNCTVFPGVVIGQDKRGRAPAIGNNVWIGAHAVVVGGIHVGSNVLIAPGSYVNFDVPDNCLVIGNPGQCIVKTDRIVEGYLNHMI